MAFDISKVALTGFSLVGGCAGLIAGLRLGLDWWDKRHPDRAKRRQQEIADREEQRGELEQWQTNSEKWRGEYMNLQGELQKRDEKIASLESDMKAVKQEFVEFKAEYADVLRENRMYRIQLGLDVRPPPSAPPGKAA